MASRFIMTPLLLKPRVLELVASKLQVEMRNLTTSKKARKKRSALRKKNTVMSLQKCSVIAKVS